MKKQEKTFFVQNLSEELKNAKSAVLINYSGMDVKTQQKLKKDLKKAGGKMLVIKNTLLKIAGKEAKIDSKMLDDEILTGQNALIIATEDPLSPIQVLGKFTKEHNVPQLRVGIIEDAFQNQEQLNKLSTLPGKDVLMSQLLASLVSPIHGLSNSLSGNLGKLIYVLKEKSKGGEK